MSDPDFVSKSDSTSNDYVLIGLPPEVAARIAALEQALATACAEVKAWRGERLWYGGVSGNKLLGAMEIMAATDANELCRKVMESK